uniref:Uncharacterized protein n=1 Tax=Sphaerodactylus townsendi TaxID=933632 RepID=A0ACB8EJT7_9SAUR
MTFLELFPLVAAVHIWKDVFRDHAVKFWCDNQAVVRVFRWPVVTLFGWLATALFTGLGVMRRSRAGDNTLDWTPPGHSLAGEGMRWSSLLFEVAELVLQFGFPDAIVLQLGENDIPAFKGVALQNAMREDLQLLRRKMPKSKLFWSCLLERRDLEERRGSGQS